MKWIRVPPKYRLKKKIFTGACLLTLLNWRLKDWFDNLRRRIVSRKQTLEEEGNLISVVLM